MRTSHAIAGATAGAAIYTAGAYALDVLVRPAIAARVARQYASARCKPMLNVGAGTPASSLRAFLFGAQVLGDVNLDIGAKDSRISPGRVAFGDVHDLPFDDGFFGSALASHVIEHVEKPWAAIAELKRVADVVLIVTPRWWAPHTWLHPGHRWYVTKDLEFITLW